MNLADANSMTKIFLSAEWVKVIHPGTEPATTMKMRQYYASLNNPAHCSTCLNLNGCCFIRGICPEIPHHPNCHCYLNVIETPNLIVFCNLDKFTKYVFKKDESKKNLFTAWGYSIMDSEELKAEYEKQAQIAYLTGNYELGLLNEHGQRITIEIKLQRKDKDGYVIIQTGWMVYPFGEIQNTTPYTG